MCALKRYVEDCPNVTHGDALGSEFLGKSGDRFASLPFKFRCRTENLEVFARWSGLFAGTENRQGGRVGGILPAQPLHLARLGLVGVR